MKSEFYVEIQIVRDDKYLRFLRHKKPETCAAKLNCKENLKALIAVIIQV